MFFFLIKVMEMTNKSYKKLFSIDVYHSCAHQKS